MSLIKREWEECFPVTVPFVEVSPSLRNPLESSQLAPVMWQGLATSSFDSELPFESLYPLYSSLRPVFAPFGSGSVACQQEIFSLLYTLHITRNCSKSQNQH